MGFGLPHHVDSAVGTVVLIVWRCTSMELNYPLEIIIGLMVLCGLLYFGGHPSAGPTHPADTHAPVVQPTATNPAPGGN